MSADGGYDDSYCLMEWDATLERLLALLHDLKERQVMADVVILFRPTQQPRVEVRLREFTQQQYRRGI